MTFGQLLAFTQPILPNITEKALAEYFQSLAFFVLVVSDGSPIDDHFSQVEQFMLGDIPIHDHLTRTPTVSDASRQLLNHIIMVIGALIFNHNEHSCWYCFVVANLEYLRQLQIKKSTYIANFEIVEAKRQADLAEQKRLNKRLVNLTTKLGCIKK